jgi:hypothetical protein
MGVRKKPSVARGPKPIMEIRQPHTTIIAGVRQDGGRRSTEDGRETPSGVALGSLCTALSSVFRRLS